MPFGNLDSWAIILMPVYIVYTPKKLIVGIYKWDVSHFVTSDQSFLDHMNWTSRVTDLWLMFLKQYNASKGAWFCVTEFVVIGFVVSPYFPDMRLFSLEFNMQLFYCIHEEPFAIWLWYPQNWNLDIVTLPHLTCPVKKLLVPCARVFDGMNCFSV